MTPSALLEGALIPLGELMDRKIEVEDRDREIVVYCRSGNL